MTEDGEIHTIPARRGRAACLKKGQESEGLKFPRHAKTFKELNKDGQAREISE